MKSRFKWGNFRASFKFILHAFSIFDFNLFWIVFFSMYFCSDTRPFIKCWMFIKSSYEHLINVRLWDHWIGMSKLFSNFFNFNLFAPHPNLGHCCGERLTLPVLCHEVLLIYICPDGHRKLPQPIACRVLNQQSSDSNVTL